MGKVGVALGLCSNAEARHFSKLLTEIMRKCGVNGTTWLSLSSISNLLDLWWENSKFPNMHRWILMLRCQICIHGFVKMPKKETREGSTTSKGRGGGATCLTTHQSTVEPNGVLFGRMPFSSYTARTAAMYIHFQKLSPGFSSEYSKSL